MLLYWFIEPNFKSLLHVAETHVRLCQAGILVGPTLECSHDSCGSHSTGPAVAVASSNAITADVKDSFA